MEVDRAELLCSQITDFLRKLAARPDDRLEHDTETV